MTTTEASDAQTPTQPKAPKRKRRWRRRIFSFLFVMLLLVVLAPLALALGPVRDWVAGKIGDRIGRRVEIQSASGFWFKGIDIEGITVHSPQGFDRPLATVEKVHADIDVLGLLAGKGGATVVVTAPHVTFLRNAEGRGNADGVMERLQGEEATRTEAADAKSGDASDADKANRFTISLRVENGRVEAARRPGETPRGIRDIDVDFRMAPNESSTVKFTGRMERMGVSGGDVELRASSAMAADGGPFEFTCSEAVDLAQLAPIAEGMAAMKGLRGSLLVDLKGTVNGKGAVAGNGAIKGQNVALESSGGLRAQIGAIDLTTVCADVESGTRATAKGTLRDVRLTQSRETGAPVSLTEPQIDIDIAALRSTDGKAITVDTMKIAAGRTLDVSSAQPIRLTLDEAWSAAGQIVVRADLGRLGALQALAPKLAELRAGQFIANVRAESDGGVSRVAAGLRITGLEMDPGETFARGYREPRIDIAARCTQEEGKPTIVDLQSLRLAGVIVSQGKIEMHGDDANASFHTDVDLAAANVVAAFLALEPGARLGGRLQAETRFTSSKASSRAVGHVVGRNLRWARPGKLDWSEPTLRIDHDVTLPAEGRRGQVAQLKAQVGSLVADASGSTWTSAPETHVDATLVLSGQSEHIVNVLAMARGQGFEDLRAHGPVSGKITVRGPASAAEVLIDGDLAVGTWESAGLVMADTRVTMKRTAASQPLTSQVRAGLNGGTFAFDTHLELQHQHAKPWRATLDITNADTSKVLLSKGAGKFISFLLPSLVPSGATVPAMSGQLGAKVELAAQDVSGDVLAATVKGDSHIWMEQGEIRNSTLFGGAGSQPMRQLMTVLSTAAPEAHGVLASLSKALVFSKLDSKVRVADRVAHVDSILLQGAYVEITSKGQARFDERIAMETNVVLQGKPGDRLAKLLPDRTIPLQVQGLLSAPQVTPRVDAGKLIQGGVAEKGKELLEGVAGKKGKKLLEGLTGGKKKNPLGGLGGLIK